MEFYRPKRKAVNVPIIPLIDILTILLIFFIVTRGVPKTAASEGRRVPALDINLPTVKEVPTNTASDERATLEVAPDGRIILDGYELASPDFLADTLTVFRKKNPDRKLLLAADRDVTISQLFHVWDALTKAGIEIKDVPARIELPATVPFVDPLQP